MISLEPLRIFLDDIWVRFKTHLGDESAHHEKYSDADVDIIVATHTAIASAHHTKTIDASELSTGEIADARIPAGIARDIEVNDAVYVHKSLTDAHHAKTTAASEITSGQFDDARIPAGIARDTEVSGAISTHAGVVSAHHTKYTDADVVEAIEAEAELDLKLFKSATQPRVYVYDSAVITIPSWAWTLVDSWDTAIFNVGPAGGQMWNAGVNPSRFTVKNAGLYIIYGYGRWMPNATGRRLIQIYINGVAKLTNEASPAGGQHVSVAVIAIFALAVNDYVELYFYQSSGGDLDLEATDVRTGFMAARLC